MGFGRGVRAAMPVAVAVFFVALSFGAAARPILGEAATVVMSCVLFAGGAQFAATAVLAEGGGPAAAIVAGTMLNARFVPMCMAVAPSQSGGPLRRALEGLAVNDASWALANQGRGRFDRGVLVGATIAQYPAWTLGTLLGVLGGDLLGDPAALGLQAVFPAFFLALLVEEVTERRGASMALAGAALTVALLPFVPLGVAVLAAVLPALTRLRAA
jgi:branched chain amino acid efflux pump